MKGRNIVWLCMRCCYRLIWYHSKNSRNWKFLKKCPHVKSAKYERSKHISHHLIKMKLQGNLTIFSNLTIKSSIQVHKNNKVFKAHGALLFILLYRGVGRQGNRSFRCNFHPTLKTLLRLFFENNPKIPLNSSIQLKKLIFCLHPCYFHK